EVAVALELAFSFPVIFKKSRNQIEPISRAIPNYISDNCISQIHMLSSKYFYICSEAVWHRIIPVSNFINNFGIEGLFLKPRSVNVNTILNAIMAPGENLTAFGFAPIFVELLSFLRF